MEKDKQEIEFTEETARQVRLYSLAVLNNAGPLRGVSVAQFYKFYNDVTGENAAPETCSDCLRRKVRRLEQLSKQFLNKKNKVVSAETNSNKSASFEVTKSEPKESKPKKTSKKRVKNEQSTTKEKETNDKDEAKASAKEAK